MPAPRRPRTGANARKRAGRNTSEAAAARLATAALRRAQDAGVLNAAAEARAGEKSKALGPAQRALRDQLVFHRREQGWMWEDIGEEVGMTGAGCRKAYARAAAAPSAIANEADPRELVREIEQGMRRSLNAHEVRAYIYADINPSVALGAAKSADEIRAQLLALYDRVGILPEDWNNLRSNDEIQRMVMVFAKVIGLIDEGQLQPNQLRAYLVSEGIATPEQLGTTQEELEAG